jgi:hypothetical protein
MPIVDQDEDQPFWSEPHYKLLNLTQRQLIGNFHLGHEYNKSVWSESLQIRTLGYLRQGSQDVDRFRDLGRIYESVRRRKACQNGLDAIDTSSSAFLNLPLEILDLII